MSSKINRLRAERGKNDEKIAVLRARNNEIDKQITELENLDIVGMVRSMGMTPEQLAEVPPGAEPTAFWGMVTECGTRRVKLPLTLGGCRIDGRLAEFTELGKLMRT